MGDRTRRALFAPNELRRQFFCGGRQPALSQGEWLSVHPGPLPDSWWLVVTKLSQGSRGLSPPNCSRRTNLY